MSASTEKKLRREARENGTDKKILAAQEEAKKKTKSKRRWTIGTIAVVVCIALVLLLSSSLMYTHTTAVKVGNERFSPAEVNYVYGEQYWTFYNNYGSYASMFGLDTTYGISGLSSQSCSLLENGTWKDYFMNSALSSLEQYVALKHYAEENGLSLDEEALAEIETEIESLSSYAASYGFSDTDSFLVAYYGKYVDTDVVREMSTLQAIANLAYQNKLESLEYSDAQLEEYYASLNGSSDLFDYDYYYVAAETVASGEGENATSAATEETLAAAKETADAILAVYNSGTSEDPYENLQAAVSATVADAAVTDRDGASGSTISTLYSEWMLDPARQTGDVTVVEDPGAGYHVVVFESRNDNHYPTVSVRHILVKAEADADGNYTDEALAAAKASAEDILAEWQAGAATEDSFAELANQYSDDTGSNTNGGLYEDIARGQMVENFEAFCFDEGHSYGDTGIVYGESSGYAGYHVMFYVGEGELYSNVIARNSLTSEEMSEWLSTIETEEAKHGLTYNLVG